MFLVWIKSVWCCCYDSNCVSDRVNICCDVGQKDDCLDISCVENVRVLLVIKGVAKLESSNASGLWPQYWITI